MTANIMVEIATDDDIPEYFQVMSNCFGHDAPFVDICFPGHDTTDGLKAGTRRLLAWKQKAPELTFLKAVLEGKVMGIAVWTLMREATSPDISKYEDEQAVWPDEEDREYMKQLWSSYVVSRSNAIEQGGSMGIYDKHVDSKNFYGSIY